MIAGLQISEPWPTLWSMMFFPPENPTDKERPENPMVDEAKSGVSVFSIFKKVKWFSLTETFLDTINNPHSLSFGLKCLRLWYLNSQ